MFKDVRRTRAVYVCKNGWAPTGIGCTRRKFIYNWQLSVEFIYGRSYSAYETKFCTIKSHPKCFKAKIFHRFHSDRAINILNV